MKKFVLLTLLIVGQMLTAQVTRSLGDFSTVKVFDRINVTLVKASENKIVINGSRAEDVEVVTKNNELKIRMKVTKLLQGENIDATLYYKNVDQVEASEGSFVSSADTFKATAFSVNAKEGSQIKLTLDVQKLSSKGSSGAILELAGRAANHSASLTAGAELKAKELKTSQTDVTINAGGEADIYATDFVDAKTRAGGEIDIYGNPRQVNKKTTAGGDITIHK